MTRADAAATATLTLQQVFGATPASLTVAFGSLDALCISLATPGVTCVADAPTTSATWYGSIQFSVRLSGAGSRTTLRLVGAQQAGGTIPSTQLLDGSSGVPATSYPVSPASPITLATALGNGTTNVNRSLGIKVRAVDAAAAWSSQLVYTLIVE